MTGAWRARMRQASAWLPSRAPAAVARDLVRRANAARDARRWQAASALYEAALGIGPGQGGIHIQCGHMLKEAGDYAGAERHYLAGAALLPETPDLALQLGHFYKVASRPDEAERAYRRAAELKPGWGEALEELARIRSSAEDDSRPHGSDQVVPELLPGGPHTETDQREAIIVRRLGAARMRTSGGYARILRGVEAIRGSCIAAVPVIELQLLLDGEVIRREPLVPLAMPGSTHHESVFNLWHDFTDRPEGPTQVELRFVDERGKQRAHRAALVVAPPHTIARPEVSDAAVQIPTGTAGSVETRVAALPSVVRSAQRAPLSRTPRAILVQRVDQIGDLVCSVPALLRLRTLFPEARIVALVSYANAALAHTLPMVDEIVVADFAERDGERRRSMPAAAQEALRRTLAPYRFDLAIDLGEGAESRPVLLLSGAPFLYGFAAHQCPWLSASMEIAAPDPVNRQETIAHGRKIVALIDGLAAMLGGDARALPAPPVDLTQLGEMGIAPEERIAVLHTGARLAYSRWPGIDALAALLVTHTDLTVVVMHDADEGTPPAGRVGRVVTIRGRLPFALFDALLARAAVFVGNDSGPKHLASLRGTPVVSLHMARLNWNEWGQELTGSIISRRVPCAGCGISDRPQECGKEFACIRDIRPEEVLATVLSELALPSTPSAHGAA